MIYSVLNAHNLVLIVGVPVMVATYVVVLLVDHKKRPNAPRFVQLSAAITSTSHVGGTLTVIRREFIYRLKKMFRRD